MLSFQVYEWNIPVSSKSNPASLKAVSLVLSTITYKHTTTTPPYQRHMAARYRHQDRPNCIQLWLRIWRIRLNKSKLARVTIVLRYVTCSLVLLSNRRLPQIEGIKYLGMHLYLRPTWRNHIATKTSCVTK